MLLTIVEAGTEMTLTLAVDELDILSVEPGRRLSFQSTRFSMPN